MKKCISLMICILCMFMTACNVSTGEKSLWETATYTEDAELGNGGKVVTVDVVAGDKTVTFTINTDKEALGDALLEHGLISGEKGPYGLYVKVVNGITADYDINQSYWSLTKNSGYMQTGVDSTKISDGEHYEFTYMK